MRELVLGMALGFSAGISPGPLMALVLSSTLRAGLPAGIRVAAAPLVTDAPVILLALTVLATLPARLVSGLGVLGGLFVSYLALTTLKEARGTGGPVPADDAAQTGRALRQGVIVNFLSPHPWLFWLAVGGPQLITAWGRGPGHAGAFLLGFYGLLVGSKVALALGVANARRRIGARAYRRLLASSGVLLMASAVVLLVEFVPRLGQG